MGNQHPIQSLLRQVAVESETKTFRVAIDDTNISYIEKIQVDFFPFCRTVRVRLTIWRENSPWRCQAVSGAACSSWDSKAGERGKLESLGVEHNYTII